MQQNKKVSNAETQTIATVKFDATTQANEPDFIVQTVASDATAQTIESELIVQSIASTENTQTTVPELAVQSIEIAPVEPVFIALPIDTDVTVQSIQPESNVQHILKRKGKKTQKSVERRVTDSNDDPKYQCPDCQRTYDKKAHMTTIAPSFVAPVNQSRTPSAKYAKNGRQNALCESTSTDI